MRGPMSIFRVEGDTDANLLFVDASRDNVGIGNNDPEQKLGIISAANDKPLIGAYNPGAAYTTSIIYAQTATASGTGFNLFAGLTNVSSTRFKVIGNGNVENTNNSYGGISDVRLKQDIVDAGSQWEDIKNLRVRKYRFKDNPDGFLQIGVIAQEVETFSPGLIEETPNHEFVESPVLDNGNPVFDENGQYGTLHSALRHLRLRLRHWRRSKWNSTYWHCSLGWRCCVIYEEGVLNWQT
jgi:hypothetical protein